MTRSIVIVISSPSSVEPALDVLRRVVVHAGAATRDGTNEFFSADGSWAIEMDTLADDDPAWLEYVEWDTLPPGLGDRLDECTFVYTSYRNDSVFMRVLRDWLEELGPLADDVFLDNDYGEMLTGSDALARLRNRGDLRTM